MLMVVLFTVHMYCFFVYLVLPMTSWGMKNQHVAAGLTYQ